MDILKELIESLEGHITHLKKVKRQQAVEQNWDVAASVHNVQRQLEQTLLTAQKLCEPKIIT